MKNVALVTVLWTAACGDEAAAVLPLGAAEADEACGVFCDYAVGCGWADPGSCRAWCGDVVAVIRADAAEELLACYTEADCVDAAEDRCIATAIDAIEPTAIVEDMRAACNDAEVRCTANLACEQTYYLLFSDPTLDAMTACFAEACGDIEPCLGDVF